ncbi:hypothetical protein PZ938_13885 [Luteipulveratus sp. YIM 133132]|uniref:hypothetical protein n=1 Tax=Luteipulveratus flavus TaxID=3031728 RepID=UPI0023AE7EDD|nr:hypothetical protein [Luteipulveratus sp. YIM 133132]MDE9366700.1 hypothetical protein [Luteipulveratus sp. YIM 133132]
MAAITRLSHHPAAVVDRAARAGLWLLLAYALLLALGTLTHQPDYAADFDGYARYVTTGGFLAGHLLASIGGAGLGVLGATAACAYLVRGPAPRLALAGLTGTVMGNVVTASVFGAAAFAQPAIGRAYLDGAAGVVPLNDDVYGTPLVLTAVVGLLLLAAGAVLLGMSLRRSGLRGPGLAYAVLLPLFAVAGFTVEVAQPVAAVGLAVAAVLIARRLPAAVTGE